MSIKNIVIIVFIFAMLISITSIGYLVFTKWFSSAKETTESIAEDINSSIHNQIYSFLQLPKQINETNFKIIESGILNMSDEKLRDKFFVGVLSSYNDEIYSFSYGTIKGEYYGARRNEIGAIEIMRNDAKTGGNSWYYSVNEDMSAGELVVEAGPFDPRTRAWYKEAVEAGKITFSPVYKHFIMNDLTISVACPIYTREGQLQGVLGSHMLLTDIGGFLKDTVSKYSGYAMIIEKDSKNLIANSMGIENFSVNRDGTLNRYSIDEIEEPDFNEAYEKYNESLDPHFFYEGIDKNLYINIKEIQMEGLNWVVISAFPEDPLIAPVLRSIHMTVLLSSLALLLSVIIYNIITKRLMKPINSLLQVSETLSSGDLTKRVEIVRNDEIGRISESFNKVADNLQFLINNLEYVVNERTKELHNMSCHDSLTGLYNRRCFEENRIKIDITENLPLSVIFADINGLKMTNDIFGHVAGDELIKKSAEILLKSCREYDMIARVGGDEFIILLPKTNIENAEKILSRIKSEFLNARVAAIKCSISLGCDTKIVSEQSLEEIMANAENAMYKNKTMNRKTVNKGIIDTLIETLHSRSPREKRHSAAVSELCCELGAALHLPESTITKLKLAGYLHDIGKITLDESIFAKDTLSEEECEKIQQHSIVGYRILNLFDETLDLAEYVYNHHECWDGSGYPRGLKGEQIPFLSRILSVAEVYERALNRVEIPITQRTQKALEIIKGGAGKQFDPKIVEVFAEMKK